MNLSEMAALRTKLREVNIKYSALVRSKAGEGRFVRLGELRVERRALMALIAKERGPEPMECLPLYPLPGRLDVNLAAAHVGGFAGAQPVPVDHQ